MKARIHILARPVDDQAHELERRMCVTEIIRRDLVGVQAPLWGWAVPVLGVAS